MTERVNLPPTHYALLGVQTAVANEIAYEDWFKKGYGALGSNLGELATQMEYLQRQDPTMTYRLIDRLNRTDVPSEKIQAAIAERRAQLEMQPQYCG